jgi:hypothetical protein
MAVARRILMMLRIGSALVACAAFACTPVSPSPASSPTSTVVTGADEGVRAPQDPEAAPASIAGPVRARVAHCRSTTGGKLVVRVQRAPNAKLAFDVAPSSSLDPLEKKCVLDALSKLDIDESSTAWGGANLPPTGFTSLVTVEW